MSKYKNKGGLSTVELQQLMTFCSPEEFFGVQPDPDISSI